MNRLHYFNDSLGFGKEGENFLNQFFAGRGFSVRSASRDEDRIRHIDAWLKPRNKSREISVQYKTDRESITTGNCFIEHVSVDAPDIKKGWIYTTEAEYLIYFIPPPTGIIYVARMADVQSHFKQWATQSRLKRRWVANRDRQGHDYFTGGILVPRSLFESSVMKVYTVPKQPESRAA